LFCAQKSIDDEGQQTTDLPSTGPVRNQINVSAAVDGESYEVVGRQEQVFGVPEPRPEIEFSPKLISSICPHIFGRGSIIADNWRFDGRTEVLVTEIVRQSMDAHIQRALISVGLIR
jgi:hypothetical protein